MKKFVEFVQSLAKIDEYRGSRNPLEQVAVQDAISGSATRHDELSTLVITLNSQASDLGQFAEQSDYGSRTQELSTQMRNLAGQVQEGLSVYDSAHNAMTAALPALQRDYGISIAEDGRYRLEDREVSAGEMFREQMGKLEMPTHLREVMEIVRHEDGYLRRGWESLDADSPRREAYELLDALGIVHISAEDKKVWFNAGNYKFKDEKVLGVTKPEAIEILYEFSHQ